jgi:hypothetical protein
MGRPAAEMPCPIVFPYVDVARLNKKQAFFAGTQDLDMPAKVFWAAACRMSRVQSSSWIVGYRVMYCRGRSPFVHPSFRYL